MTSHWTSQLVQAIPKLLARALSAEILVALAIMVTLLAGATFTPPAETPTSQAGMVNLVVAEDNSLRFDGRDTLLEDLQAQIDAHSDEGGSVAVRVWVASGASPRRVQDVMREVAASKGTPVTPQSDLLLTGDN